MYHMLEGRGHPCMVLQQAMLSSSQSLICDDGAIADLMRIIIAQVE